MQKNLEIRKELRTGDITYVQELTKTQKLNKGKGYSYKYVVMVLNGERNNNKIIELFEKLISSRKRLTQELQS